MSGVDPPESSIGSQLKALRQSRGLSLGALSRLSGVHDSTLSRWENGKRQPLIPELEAVLDALQAGDADRRALLRQLDAPRSLARLREMDATASPPVAGDLLQALRLRKGWTQTETARAVGIHQAQIARWEHGDSWPSDEKLHLLCWHLGAQDEEMAELSAVGAGGQLHFGDVPPMDELSLPTDGRGEPYEAITRWGDYVAQHLRVPPERFVLTIFRLEHRLSLLAPRHALAEQLLPNAYAIQARHHLQRQERRQAEAAAQRGLALAQRHRLSGSSDTNRALWFANVIVLAALAAESGSPTGLQRAVHLLKQWLPAVRGCHAHYSWGCADLATYLARLGKTQEAVILSANACQCVARNSSGDYQYRLHDYAHVLCQVALPREALQVLDKSRTVSGSMVTSSPFFSIRQELLEAECLLLLQDKARADERFRAAEQIVSNNQTDPQHARFISAIARVQKVVNH